MTDGALEVWIYAEGVDNQLFPTDVIEAIIEHLCPCKGKRWRRRLQRFHITQPCTLVGMNSTWHVGMHEGDQDPPTTKEHTTYESKTDTDNARARRTGDPVRRRRRYG